MVVTAGGPPRTWRGSTGRGCPEPVWDDQVTGASCWPGWGQLSAAAHLSPDKTDSYVRITYNIDRPAKYTLPLFNMTNLSSKWKVGWFCRLKLYPHLLLIYVCTRAMPTKEKKASKRFQSLKRRQCFAPLSYYFIGYKYCMTVCTDCLGILLIILLFWTQLK